MRKRRFTPWLEQFWAQVSKSEGCWIWTGTVDRDGYGAVRLKGVKKAHRVAWSLANGPIPEGMCVLHRCDTPACCNPEHLSIGTHRDNQADKLAKGRESRGEKHGKAKLSDADVDLIRLAFETLPCTKAALARAFCVSEKQILNIIRGDQRKTAA